MGAIVHRERGLEGMENRLEGSSGIHLLGQVWDLKRQGLSIQGQPRRGERQPLLRAITWSTWGRTAQRFRGLLFNMVGE